MTDWEFFVQLARVGLKLTFMLFALAVTLELFGRIVRRIGRCMTKRTAERLENK